MSCNAHDAHPARRGLAHSCSKQVLTAARLAAQLARYLGVEDIEADEKCVDSKRVAAGVHSRAVRLRGVATDERLGAFGAPI
jgi:hypothetical protein